MVERLDGETDEQYLARGGDLTEEENPPEAEIEEITLDVESPPLSEEEQEAAATLKAEEDAAPQWVKNLRKKNEEDNRELLRIRRENEELKKQKGQEAPKPIELGEKPTLAGCDYDEEVFETKTQEYLGRKAQLEAEETKKTEAQKRDEEAYKGKLTAYNESAAKLKLPDYADMEAAVKAALSVTQQGLIIAYCADPAKLCYALGKNPKALQQLASETDPIKFAFAVSELQGKLKVKTRNAPAPESKVRGNAAITGTADKELERLREKAAKTNDYTEVNAYKRKQREAKK